MKQAARTGVSLGAIASSLAALACCFPVGAAVAAGLWLLRSELPQDLRRRRGAVYPAVAQGGSREILGSGREP